MRPLTPQEQADIAYQGWTAAKRGAAFQNCPYQLPHQHNERQMWRRGFSDHVYSEGWKAAKAGDWPGQCPYGGADEGEKRDHWLRGFADFHKGAEPCPAKI